MTRVDPSSRTSPAVRGIPPAPGRSACTKSRIVEYSCNRHGTERRALSAGPSCSTACPAYAVEMFVLVLIAWPVLEVFVFIEVGLAIGWLPAVVLLLGTSLLGIQVLRVQGRTAVERVSAAVSERRAPGRAALDGVLGFLGGVLLVIPGFVTDALGALLVLAPIRALVRRWISRR